MIIWLFYRYLFIVNASLDQKTNSMKTLYKSILLIFLAALLAQPIYAQRLLRKLTEKARNKVEEKMEEKAEQEAEKKLDEELDKIFELNDEQTDAEKDKARQARMQKMMKGFGMSGEPVPIADNYRFGHLIQMHVESYDEKGEKISTGEFITHFNPDSKSMAYQMVSGDMATEGQGMFIIDAENNAMIILNDENNEKTGIVYGIGTFFQTMGEDWEEEAELEESPETYLANPNVKKTGNSKKIAGYNCDEYVYSDEETESNIWITTDMKMNTRDFFSTLFQTSLYSHGIPWGYMMEVETDNKETGEKSTMQVTKVDENSNASFALGEYQITNIGSFQVPIEEESGEEKPVKEEK